MKKLATISFGLLILFGCSGKTEFEEKYKEAYVSACYKGPEGENVMRKICECQADKVLENFSPKETSDSEKVKKYVTSITMECVQQEMDLNL